MRNGSKGEVGDMAMDILVSWGEFILNIKTTDAIILET